MIIGPKPPTSRAFPVQEHLQAFLGGSDFGIQEKAKRSNISNLGKIIANALYHLSTFILLQANMVVL